jgi:hypothetical protein
MSWIHYEDFIAAVRWLIDRDDISGAVNVASPNPLANAEFMRVLREACGVPFGLPANRCMLEIGAVLMRTETELILKSRRVVPARLLEHGFTFRYPDWRDAAGDLVRLAIGASISPERDVGRIIADEFNRLRTSRYAVLCEVASAKTHGAQDDSSKCRLANSRPEPDFR